MILQTFLITKYIENNSGFFRNFYLSLKKNKVHFLWK
jgi:hypothetical protein